MKSLFGSLFVIVSVFSFSLEAYADRLGLTWQKISHDAALGVDLVGTAGGDPYIGDTACSTALPVLCIHQDGAADPGVVDTGYEPWAFGKIALTSSVVGNTLSSQSAGDQLCFAEFGEGYRMAEFHDGWGWNFQAYGNVSDASRFWVAIHDTYANCWDPEFSR